MARELDGAELRRAEPGGGREQAQELLAATTRVMTGCRSIGGLADNIGREIVPLLGAELGALGIRSCDGERWSTTILGQAPAAGASEVRVCGSSPATTAPRGLDRWPPRLGSIDGVDWPAPLLRQLLRGGATRLLTLPLETPRRSVGAISFALGAALPSWASESILRALALQLALAVENILQAEVAPAPPAAALVRDRDDLSMVLEVARAAASLELPQLIQQIADRFSASRLRWEHTSICLHEPAENALRVYFLSFAPGPLAAHNARALTGVLIPLDGTLGGRAFVTGQPQVVNSRAEYTALVSCDWGNRVLSNIPPDFSSCVVPLVCRDRRLGTLGASTSREGAFDSHAVQLMTRIGEVVAPAVDNALAYQRIQDLSRRLTDEKNYLESEIGSSLGEIVGESDPVRQLLARVESVARTDSTVLICGETGTGKELVARAIHRLSRRGGRTFVKVNCATFPSGVVESELFGHEKGSFSGAIAHRVGRFELAHGGTLFLDEVGELPLEVQPKLLRVLQDRELERVGGARTIKVDVRVVAATNRDLLEMQRQRLFRSDLFYRLNVFPIAVPPLRERAGDIALLVRHFLQRSSRRLNKQVDIVPAETLAALERYHWPGNVRELENVIERAVILARGRALQVSPSEMALEPPALPAAPAPPAAGSASAGWQDEKTLAAAERAFIVEALERCRWVVGGPRGAAARLGMRRTTLQARMRKLDICRPQ